MPLNSQKYALVERERRFLVDRMPSGEPWAVRRITDRYIEGTRLRLRKSDGVVDGQTELVYKLTQKVPTTDGPSGRQGLITNTYLDKSEYEKLSSLPGLVLEKTRYSFPPMGIDEFQGSLQGLMIAEAEFETDDEMTAFAAPEYCGREVTADERYTGGNFVRLAHSSTDPWKSLGY